MKKLNLLVLIAALLSGCGGEKDSKSNEDSSSDPKPETPDEAMTAMIGKTEALNETLANVQDKESAEKHKPKIASQLSEIKKLKEQMGGMKEDLTDEEEKELMKKHLGGIMSASMELQQQGQRLESSDYGAEIAKMIKNVWQK